MLRGIKRIEKQPQSKQQTTIKEVESTKQLPNHYTNGQKQAQVNTQKLYDQQQQINKQKQKQVIETKKTYIQGYQQQSNQKLKKNKHNSKLQSNKISQKCYYCPQNQQVAILSVSNHVYLAFTKLKTFRKYWHLIIAPIQHQQTTIGLDDQVIQQITNYKKCLLQMFDQMNLHVVFWQQFSIPNSHIYIECLAMKLNKAQDLPFFLKQSLENIEGNWTTHHNIIQIRKQKGGLQKQIPKKLTYFYIDFSLGYGYAHVIQDQKSWKNSFIYEVFASALNLQQFQVKTKQQYSKTQLQLKTNEFEKIWKEYDWTKLL